MKARNFLVLVLFIFLTACGTDPKDRTQGGAAAGAGSGAVLGMWAGPPGMLVGAVIGGGAGALAGATVPEENLDLGDPVWKNR